MSTKVIFSVVALVTGLVVFGVLLALYFIRTSAAPLSQGGM